MCETKTIWICPDCKLKLTDDAVAGELVQPTLECIEAGALVTIGFRDVDDHHRDCDLRNSAAGGHHDYDCNVSCEEWDGCPYDCAGCGEGAGRTSYAATLWPAPVTA